MKWIELVTGFTCNCRCVVCPSASMGNASMTAEELDGWLQEGSRQGASGVWYGGGEPTLHPHLIPSIGKARSLGYDHIRIQTNGMRFAYMPFATRCVEAGVDQVAFSIKGADPESHDAITRNPGSFAHMTEGIKNLISLGVRVEGEVLVTTQSMHQLRRTISEFAERGIGHFTFWLFSTHGLEDPRAAERLPSFSDLRPHLDAAFEAAASLGVEATSLHTPPCVLSPAFRDRYVHSGTWELVVVTPGSEPFMAEESPMEGGVYVDACSRCSLRADCLGFRSDYIEHHGTDGIRPL